MNLDDLLARVNAEHAKITNQPYQGCEVCGLDYDECKCPEVICPKCGDGFGPECKKIRDELKEHLEWCDE